MNLFEEGKTAVATPSTVPAYDTSLLYGTIDDDTLV